MRRLINRFRHFFLLPRFREWIVNFRIFYFVQLRKQIATLNSEKGFNVTVKHNMKSLRQCNKRMEMIIKPISVIEKVKHNARILVIGPRNENDLFLLFGNGFDWENIYGLDLISYSPRIKLGDMHSIPFEENFFDAVICGWTLSYSAQPQAAADEILRIIKSGGTIGIGVEYSTMTKEDTEHLLKYSIQFR